MIRRVARGAGRALLALLVVLLAGELLLRMNDDFGRNGPDRIRDRTSVDGAQVYRGRPWYEHEFDNPVHLNREGFHAAEFDADPARPTRIAVLGDSYVRGLHVTREENLVAAAQRLTPGVQLLALGRSAGFAPDQLVFLRNEFDGLFGPEGSYPAVDGVVFCIRSHSTRHVAEGSVAYPDLPPPHPRWNHRWKEQGHAARRAVPRRFLRSRSHVVSFLAQRVDQWFGADLRRSLTPLSDEGIADAHDLMRERVLEPMLAAAAARGLRVGFLYLPSVTEATGSASRFERDIHRRWIAAWEELGVPWEDAGAGLADPSALFFPSDRHPNVAGHAAFGAALARLVSEMDQGRSSRR